MAATLRSQSLSHGSAAWAARLCVAKAEAETFARHRRGLVRIVDRRAHSLSEHHVTRQVVQLDSCPACAQTGKQPRRTRRHRNQLQSARLQRQQARVRRRERAPSSARGIPGSPNGPETVAAGCSPPWKRLLTLAMKTWASCLPRMAEPAKRMPNGEALASPAMSFPYSFTVVRTAGG